MPANNALVSALWKGTQRRACGRLRAAGRRLEGRTIAVPLVCRSGRHAGPWGLEYSALMGGRPRRVCRCRSAFGRRGDEVEVYPRGGQSVVPGESGGLVVRASRRATRVRRRRLALDSLGFKRLNLPLIT